MGEVSFAAVSTSSSCRASCCAPAAGLSFNRRGVLFGVILLGAVAGVVSLATGCDRDLEANGARGTYVTNTSADYGVHSEVGKLRKVLVCSPGLAHERLTPTNCDDLLFDDVLWVQNARRDHFDFMDKMRDRDVEVVELHDVLTETMDDPDAKAWLLDRKIVAERGRPRPGRRHPRLPRLAAAAPARRVADRRHVDARPARRHSVRLSRAGARGHRGHRIPDAAAAEHALHPRHDVLDLRRPDAQPAVLARPTRRDAADEGDLRVPSRLRRLDGVVGRSRTSLGAWPRSRAATC